MRTIVRLVEPAGRYDADVTIIARGIVGFR